EDLPGNNRFLQLRKSFIITAIRSGLMVIDQHLAHSRILYEKYLKQLERGQQGSQQELFPHQIRLNSDDAAVLKEIMQELAILGYQINPVSSNTFVVNGTPDGLNDKDIQELIELMIEQYKRNSLDLQLQKKLNLARTMASQTAIKYGQALSEQEMTSLIDQLFACQVPEISPDGRKIIVTLPLEQLQQLFKLTL
ncbi:MAG TPA: hypothetical protein PLC47_06670, partial [Bacteroidales bacterium]|nr:hypothetical protein [Bacteroidales bacterium]